MIDHEIAVQQKMTERFLLGELDSDKREEFEEHFFSCAECAHDVRAGVLFLDHSKVVLNEQQVVAVPVPAPQPPSPPWWMRWLHPAFTAPVLALALAVAGYQNLVEYPRLLQPTVVAMAKIDVDSFSGDEKPLNVAQGSGFILQVRTPPNGNYLRNTAELLSPTGKVEGPITLPAAVDGQAQWAIQFQSVNRQSGTYTLVIRGVNASGESKELSRKSFELQIQK